MEEGFFSKIISPCLHHCLLREVKLEKLDKKDFFHLSLTKRPSVKDFKAPQKYPEFSFI
jgi:hypothetical protein